SGNQSFRFSKQFTCWRDDHLLRCLNGALGTRRKITNGIDFIIKPLNPNGIWKSYWINIYNSSANTKLSRLFNHLHPFITYFHQMCNNVIDLLLFANLKGKM